MAITRFEDTPSTSTPINSANLNGNFDELGAKVGTSIDSNYRTNIIKGKNLIDLSSMLISGGYSDTGFVVSSNYITIQYIQVRPNTTYTLSTNLSTSKYTVLRIVDFNSNKTFIRRSGGTALASSNTFTTSSDAYYLAFCFYTNSTASTSDITQAQLEKGSTATTYEAYITPSIVVDGEEIYNKDNLNTYLHNKIPITPANASNYAPFGNSYYYKAGNKVHIHLGLQNLTANTVLTIFEMPADYRPFCDYFSVPAIGGNMANKAGATVKKSDGKINVRSEDTYLFADFEYDVE